jgi:hypothetical protein
MFSVVINGHLDFWFIRFRRLYSWRVTTSLVRVPKKLGGRGYNRDRHLSKRGWSSGLFGIKPVVPVLLGPCRNLFSMTRRRMQSCWGVGNSLRAHPMTSAAHYKKFWIGVLRTNESAGRISLNLLPGQATWTAGMKQTSHRTCLKAACSGESYGNFVVDATGNNTHKMRKVKSQRPHEHVGQMMLRLPRIINYLEQPLVIA